MIENGQPFGSVIVDQARSVDSVMVSQSYGIAMMSQSSGGVNISQASAIPYITFIDFSPGGDFDPSDFDSADFST